MRIELGMLAALAAVPLVLPRHAQAWRQEIDGGRATAVALDGGGDVVATGSIGAPDTARDFAVLKYDGATGAEIWRYTRDGTETPAGLDLDEGAAVAVDPMGDVLAAGRLHNTGSRTDFVVVKLAGGTGAELWRVEIDGPFTGIGESDEAKALALDAAGNAIAVGHLCTTGAQHDLIAVKLAAATGAELWRVEEDAGGFEDGRTVALDAAGDVVVGGVVDGTASILKLAGATGAELWRSGTAPEALALGIDASGDVVGLIRANTNSPVLAVVKLAGVSGLQVWRNDVPDLYVSALEGGDVAIDAAGNAVVAASVASPPGDVFPSLDFGVVKLAAATGTELWRTALDGTRAQGNDESARSVAIDGSGNVVTAGFLFNAVTYHDLAVAKLAGASGALIWLEQVDDASPGDDALAVAIDPGGNPVAAGILDDDFSVLRLAAGDGGIGPVFGKKLLVRDRAGNSAGRKLVGRLEDQAIAVPPPGSGGDPTASGAWLRLVNPTTAESVSLPLDGPLWSGLGLPPGSRGYQYRGNSGGPCRLVRVRRGQVTATCSSQLGPLLYTLDEPSQGSLTLSLQLGTSEPQCATFGGVIRDAGTSNPGPIGIFRAKNAPAISGDCP